MCLNKNKNEYKNEFNRSSLHIDRCKYAKNNFLLKIIIKNYFYF